MTQLAERLLITEERPPESALSLDGLARALFNPDERITQAAGVDTFNVVG